MSIKQKRRRVLTKLVACSFAPLIFSGFLTIPPVDRDLEKPGRKGEDGNGS